MDKKKKEPTPGEKLLQTWRNQGVKNHQVKRQFIKYSLVVTIPGVLGLVLLAYFLNYPAVLILIPIGLVLNLMTTNMLWQQIKAAMKQDRAVKLKK